MQRYLLEMLGLGPLADAMQSPEAQAQVMAIFQGMVETHQRVQRIEAKLDLLLSGVPVPVRVSEQTQQLINGSGNQ